ncbi:MAG: YifB family Mg chelatase-like AAA ATPase [Oscillospiraceae bacterium]|nr:YifB family Mg chelatase-like AAA ATPase [Oscillospiraceae bacterium]
MLAKVRSLSLFGITGHDILIEVDVSNGFPAFDIVGLADTAVKESKERVRSAIRNNGYHFPIMRVTVNLAPAFVKKEGSSFDLPIAIGVLLATGQISIGCAGYIGFIGELALDGAVRRVNGVLPMSIRARDSGLHALFVPADNALEAAVVEGIDVHPVRMLTDIERHFNGKEVIARMQVDAKGVLSDGGAGANAADAAPAYDFCDVKGQEQAKRALEITASGGHHCIMIGPPGSGKTMLAKRLPSILPLLTYDESVEITMLHSVAGMLPSGVSLISTRPFRNPLTSASAASLTGGGKIPKPGEISLAHNGVLFLDELPEFGAQVLDALRQPLEDGTVTVSRVASKITYPARTTFVCATNPCKCGYHNDSRKACTCTASEIRKYFGRISGPLLDRIDIQIEVRLQNYDELYKDKPPGEPSAAIRKRVEGARDIQKERYRGLNIFTNAHLEGGMVDRFCALDRGARSLMRAAFERMALSARAHDKILKVARTIADLDGSENIIEQHLAEAINYRRLDREV